ncbi:MAG TPA: WD40 repeat domain-containing protein [Gemmataceae bacterium]
MLIGGFRLDALKRVHDADLEAAAKQRAERQETIRQKEQRLRQYRYADDIAQAGRDWDKRYLENVAKLLERHRLRPGQDEPDDPRGFEWYYLSRLARTLRCRMPPTDKLYCVAFSAEGTTCATGHQDGAIRLWDSFTGQPRQVLTGHQLPVNALAYSQDGKHLVSGGGVNIDRRHEGELFLWDAATLKFRHAFPGPLGAVNTLAFSPDGRSLAAAFSGAEIKVWTMPSGTLRAAIPTTAAITSLAFCSDSATLAVGLIDGSMSLCDAANGRVLATWQGHQRYVRSVACGHANTSLVSSGIDHMVRLWGGTGNPSLAGEYRHNDDVWGVAFSPDDQTVASISADGVVKLWDVARQRECFWFAIPSGWGQTVAFSPDGKTLAVGSEDGNLWMCEVSRPVETSCWLGHREGVEPREAWAVAFSPDGKTLASAGDDHAVRLWDPVTGCERAVLRGHQSLVTCVAFSPDGKWLASGSFDEAAPVKLWDAVTGADVFTFHGHTRPVNCLAFSPDSKVLATAGRDDTVRLWDLVSRREFDTLRVHSVESLAFSPDGRGLLLASDKQAVFLWDLDRRKVRFSLPSPFRGHVAVAIAPDGETFATGDGEGTIQFWDAHTGELRVRGKHHDAIVNCLAFSPDGKTLASASFDKTVKLWQTTTGRDLLTLSHEADRVRWVTFSPDGSMLATAGHDGMLKIHRAAAP